MISLLEKEALVVPGRTELSGTIPDDPDDERVLACALEGQADLIASSDRHPLDLEGYEGIPIVNVRHFLEQLSLQA